MPFLDATSGRETYGAGRHLDLEPELDGTYALDFNLAYHPYCVYNDDYSCPLTPAENRLRSGSRPGNASPPERAAGPLERARSGRFGAVRRGPAGVDSQKPC